MATAEEAASAVEQTTPFCWKDRPFDATILPHYLGRILRAARCLAGEGDAMEIVATTDPSSTIHAIAQALIHACRLNVITTGASDLPAIPQHDSPHDVPIPEEYDDDDDEHVAAPYVWRRVDYLRHLLRALFPVQLDVAAAALPLLPQESAATTMILLGQWLPVAPQITPLVRTMVAHRNSPLQDLSSFSSLERFTMLEACHRVAAFYCRARVDYATFLHLWDWTPVFGQLPTTIHKEYNAPMQVAIDWRRWSRTQLDQATAWHAVRLAAFVLRLTPLATASYLDQHGVTRDWVPWQIHSWDTNLEEGEAQRMALLQRADLWMQGDVCATPTALEVRQAVSLPLCLVDCGEGLVLVREHPLEARCVKETELVPTPTTARNLALLAAVLCMQPAPPPVLLCGPAGSGKSTLLRSLARRVGTSLLEIHVDDETDSKTLIGCTTTTEIPGRFAWRAGALTKAVREGRWVLLEDLDRVPMEIQAALVQLLEDRLLPLGNGKVERAHPNFRLFGTHGPVDTVGRKVLNAHYWAPVPLEPLTVDEMKQVAHVRYPNLPAFVVATVLGIFQQILADGRRLVGSRMPSVRDFFKVLSRISHTIPIDAGTTFATEGQRTLCLGETMDVLAAACPEVDLRRELARSLVAPAWNVTAALATAYLEKRTPSVIQHADATELGRVRLPTTNRVERGTSSNFAITGHALRFMESIAVCIRENEPVLLVGETGGGKTTLVQQLARLAGQSVMVQNLSLQTDSTDLLGGFRPLEMKHVARRVYQEFVDLFTSTFSRKQNADFLKFTNTALTKENWKKLSQCFTRACKLGLNKMKERQALGEEAHVEAWNNFVESAERFEQQRLACDSGLAFEFTEGGLVDAIRYGKWVLLDEINLASSEILQRLCGLLDSSDSSIILTERGDSEAIRRHPNFRLFAAMNPATDAGKKDLAPSIRSRFTEMYVDEIVDPIELRLVAGKYIAPVLTQVDVPPEETETVVKIVDLYLQCRLLAESSLVDGGGHKPRYTLRTLSRALTAAKSMVVKQKFSLARSLVEGFELAFQGCLDGKSSKEMAKVISGSVGDMSSDRNQPGRRPGGREGGDDFVLLKPFWISKGSNDAVDWVHESNNGLSRYVMTPSTLSNVRCLGRVIASGPWPILLEGPTSAGKTSVVEYIASRCGFTVVRINNHEHTDISEYLGSFAPDSRGSLVFQDGLLVRALREGHWVILDELNLAPSEVLEALNRLLDDNRELYLSETNEVVKAHADFRLFATQNPSGAYGGRKPLSRAFRNRFIELHVGDIPSNEMIEILEKRSGCPPSHAKVLVAVMNALRQRRSTGNLFAGKDSLITPRDLLRWADRKASSKKELAEEGYMLLAERLRTDSEKKQVLDVIEGCSKVSVDIDALYYSAGSVASQVFAGIEKVVGDEGSKQFLRRIAPTNSFLRLVTLVERCHRRKEPVLLVGDTGCGKTTAVQLLSMIHDARLHVLNCHATTETSDLLGNLRPVRGRQALENALYDDVMKLKKISAALTDSGRVPGPGSSLDAGTTTKSASSLFAEAKYLLSSFGEDAINSTHDRKRQKVSSGGASPTQQNIENELFAELNTVYDTILQNYQKLQSIFEWSDGPLVEAMKRGDTFLLDEISLAEDAVIERLNSVLEPSRSLVLAEKTTSDSEDSRVIIADESFQLFATMNPGGDFGKRELSPALRSRFTEIWVTPISESSDVDMVLQRLLLAEGIREPTFTPLKKNMMEYFEWFNSICSDPANPREELSLSVRDIVAWTKFVSESTKKNQSIKIWEAYLHGAYLMHLDGLGLGTVLAENDVKLFKHKAEAYLKGQVEESNGDQHAVGFELLSFQRQQDRFGFDPFWIPSGPRPVETVEFDFNAPTTARNLARILRAMQLPKPILLEGSPGVGKTTLVAALAEAAGHKLVRINLSEQTDMSDLIGSDLPSDDTTSNSTAAFRWFDGTLLAAIKSGHWVLLDELNLASQSVLEGLNSCLDHRASVYIPELGYTVDCPATFRVFAAQNPLSQGGGRKGLPRSFLNRFTKVYVDALSEQDMISIAAKSFPSIPRHMSEKIVSFNSTIDCEVTEGITVGQRGGPWEFNLRDIFRLCALVRDSQDAGANDAHRRFKSYVQDLYLKRFRTWEDRRSIADMYLSEWSGGIDMLDTPLLKMSDAMVEVGTAKISRGTTGSRAQFTHEKSLSAHPFSLRGVMEAVARCVENKWPCLLVLNSSAVGISTLHTLGELAGVQICEIALTPSSDVSELIGSFEQVGCLDHLRRQIDRSINIICGLVMKSYDVGHLLVKLQKLLATSDDESLFQVVRLASDALDEAQTLIGAEGTSLDEMNDVRQNLRLSLESKEEKGNIFVWKDGVLVEAMLRGDWVHLRNANLCPASVLDRLNSVLEPNGYLMLAECGTDECSGIAGRIVNPHPNFRIFLTMDPEYGEISRAMRNRCVEIAVLPNPDTDSALYALDQMSRLWKLGIRSTALAIALSENQNEWADYPKAFPSQSFSCAIGFGCRLSFCSEAFARLHNMPPNTPGMLTTDTMEPNAVLPMCPYNGIASSENPALICALARARALQTFYPGMGSMPSVQDAVPPGVGQFKVPFVLTSADYPNMAAFIASPECEGSALRNELVVRCLADCNRLGFFEGSKTLRGTTAQSLLTIAREYRELTSSPNAADSVPESAVSHFATQKMRRIILRENRAKGDVSHRSPLLVSLLVSEGSVEQSMIVCRVTPTIYPFFVALEEWLSSFLRCNTTDSEVATKLGVVLDCYDGLWELLSLGTFSESGNELFGFPEDTFLVGWNWFKKSFRILASMQRASIRDKDLDTRLEGVTRQIDYAAFQGINPAVSGLRKLMPKPVIPRQRLAWVDFLGLKTIGAASILRLESEIDSFRPVELHHLVARHDPTLIVSANLKSDIIGALATMYAASIRDLPHFSKTGNALFVGLKRRFEDSVKEFSTSFLAIKVQSGNDDEEIPKTLEELEDIMTAARRNGSVYGDFSRSILHAFAAVQLSPCHEFICERIEAFVIREICGAIARSDAHKLTEKGGLGSKHDVEKYIRYLIDAGASKLQWRLEDLSPFQVALWAMQSPLLDHAELVGVLRAILPTLRVNLARRVWRNASHLLTTVSSRLTLPALLESTDEIEYDFDTRDLVSCDVLHRSVFNLVGSTVSPIVDSTSSACFMSIENYEPRGKQAIELANLFVLDGLTPNSPEPWEMSLMVSDILETLSKSTALPSSRDAVKIIKTDGYLDDEFQSVITRQLEAMPDVSLRALLDPTLPLLLQALGRLWRPRSNPESKCDYALVQVYAGLLRFHCYLPDSPIDPGRKPIAKMQLLNERAVRLRRRLAAVKLDSGMSNGCVNPENDETYLTLQETSAKAKNQAGKVIERVEGIPAFSGLWKELHDLSRSILDITTISGLCTSIRDKVPSFTVEMEQWQSTSAAFCAYASDKYAGYSDVIDPLVESVGTVERGLRAIAVLSSERGSIIKELSRETFQFPCGGNMQRVRNISSALSRMELEEVGPQTGRGLLNTAFSMLHQIVAYSTLSETDDERLAIFSNLLNWIMSAAEKQDFTSTIDGDVPRTDEEKEELAFRTQFPDHEKDFNIESEDDESTREDAIEQASHTDQESKLALCEEEYDSLCDVHGAIFGSESHPGKSSFDGDSLMSFRFAFSAASAFSRDGESSTLSANSYACQVLALSLSCDTVSRDTSADTNSNEFDFYHDSDPEQAKRASSALESLVSRLVGLLHVFPGNSILLKVAEVADRVRKLDMNRSPLGKIMVGLELTLKHAQDWEQHSSERTMIGEPLQALSTIVAALRRLELQSWSGLLSARERAQKSMAKKKWGDLFWLLNGYLDGIVLSSSGSDVLPRYSYLTPAWVWQHQQMMCPPEILLKKATDGLTDLVKALDSLLLASPLGEFSTRLAIVGSFATEFEILASRKAAEEVLRVARAIRSLHSYYCQFDAFISKHLSGLRLPFEKRLRDEVKLAKWDEQSYYALASSGEKSHRKLMMILREFDEALETIVSVVLEKELEKGVRPTDDTPVDTIPGPSVLFPLAGPLKGSKSVRSTRERKRRLHHPEARKLEGNDELAKLVSDTFKYVSKMDLLVDQDLGQTILSEQGHVHVDALCTSVFERIESLRNPKTTRPMKERAVVDLFKELQNQGYSGLKWRTPIEIQRFGEILLVPSVNVPLGFPDDDACSSISSANTYFLRSIAEINRMRGEAALMGQQHMTNRQVDQMLAFSSHGTLLLCQQRAVLAYTLAELGKFKENVRDLEEASRSVLPRQRDLVKAFTALRTDHTGLRENLQQTKIILQKTTRFWQQPEQLSWGRDVMACIASYLDAAPQTISGWNSLVLPDHLKTAQEIVKDGEKFLRHIRAFEEGGRQLSTLPSSVLASSIVLIEQVVNSGRACTQLISHEPRTDELSIGDCASKASELVDYCRLATQVCVKVTKEPQNTIDEEKPIWDSHVGSTTELLGVKLDRLAGTSKNLLEVLKDIHFGTATATLASSVSLLCTQLVQLLERRITEYAAFHRSAGKFQYIMLRIFRVLIAKGFCSAKITEKDGEGEGDVDGMQFEDGTGMGEGEGSRDVTDQIEDEEQLLGLKSDEKKDDDNDEPNKQLNKDEADTGMEMENDFEGDLHDLPDEDENEKSADEDDEKEELDREMGDEPDPNEEVIDKKLWDEDDEDEDGKDDGLDRGGALEGEAMEDEMITQDEKDQKEKEESREDGQKDKPNAEEPESDDDAQDEFPEDTVEENNLMNARDDRLQNEEGEEENDEEMELGEEMDLDAGDEEADNSHDDTAEESLADEASDNQDGEEDDPDDGEQESSPEEGEPTSRKADGPAETEDDDKPDDEDPPEEPLQMDSQEANAHQGLGLRSQDGKDSVIDPVGTEDPTESDDREVSQDDNGEAEGPKESDKRGSDGGSGNRGDTGTISQSATSSGKTNEEEVPNPFKSPGDVEKFWHRKLNVIQSQSQEDDAPSTNDAEEEDRVDKDGQFEHVDKGQEGTTQALVDADDHDAPEINENKGEEDAAEAPQVEQPSEKEGAIHTEERTAGQRNKNQSKDESGSQDVDAMDIDEPDHSEEKNPDEEGVTDSGADHEDKEDTGNRVVSDISQLSMEDKLGQDSRSQGIIEDGGSEMALVDRDEARSKWNRINGEVHGLSRRLCEKLRLVLEPMVATKLRGDYRTGKRINMKRVIGYIASGYRKDKIWLRRTKPSKRNYRVLVAVDDSESMANSGSGPMALKALAALSTGMSQLEIGELGVAKFGDDMQLIHPFSTPFTSESGVNLMQHFRFEQQRTRTALCVESAMLALEEPGEFAPMQLVLLISDGKIERDNRGALRRLIREMLEKNILMALIIVEGKEKKESILNLKEVAFESGRPKVRSFIEDYPFPYYIVLEDLATLPDVLGDALRQWFEMISRIDTSS